MSKVEPHFEAILALVAGGMAIEAALRSDAKFPIKATWKSYAHNKRFPDRRARLEAAQAKGKEIQKQRGFQPFHYTEAQYDRALALIADNFGTPMHALKFDGMPGYTGMHARSKLDPGFAKRFAEAKKGRMWGGRESTYSDQQYDQAVALIKEKGHGYYRQNWSSEGLPHHSQLWRRAAKADQEFGRRYFGASMAHRYFEMAARHRARKPISPKASADDQLRVALLNNDLYRRADACVSKKLDPDVRGDVISDLVEAVLAGRIAEDDLAKHCNAYVTAHFRNASPLKFRSLDAVVFENNESRSLVDTVSSCDWSCEGAI